MQCYNTDNLRQHLIEDANEKSIQQHAGKRQLEKGKFAEVIPRLPPL